MTQINFCFVKIKSGSALILKKETDLYEISGQI